MREILVRLINLITPTKNQTEDGKRKKRLRGILVEGLRHPGLALFGKVGFLSHLVV